MKLDEHHQKLRVYQIKHLGLRIEGKPVPEESDKAADDILNACANIEYCEQCAAVCCPFGEPLHFHHDGCPACDGMPDEWHTSKSRLLQLLVRNGL